MAILKTDNKRMDYRIVGASLPPQIHNYLNLYTLAKKTTKTIIIKELLTNWIRDQKKIESEGSLIKELAQRLRLEWKVRKANGGSLSDFKLDVSNELMGKGLSEEQINSILQKLNQDAENQKRSRTTE